MYLIEHQVLPTTFATVQCEHCGKVFTNIDLHCYHGYLYQDSKGNLSKEGKQNITINHCATRERLNNGKNIPT